MLCILFFCVLCEKKNIFETRWGVFSLTERTEFTELFGARFEPTEGLRHTEVTEAFQLTLAVTLCDICMPKAFCEFETVRQNVLLNL